MVESHSISWIPSWLSAAQLATFETAVGNEGAHRWSCQRPLQWAAAGEGLRAAQLALRAMPVARIAAAIDSVAQRWIDPSFEPRQRAREEVMAATGFSAQAVDRSFDVELRNYLMDSLQRTLRRELGTPEVLDGFQPDSDLPGHSHAIGPRITLCVFTGNVPGLPALSLVRALLVKSAVIAKVASGEPTFAARFVATLAQIEPCLGEAILVTYWDRNDLTSLRGALSQVDAVIAYGSDEACAAIRAQVAPHQRYIEHGHKVSLGIIGRDYLHSVGMNEVAQRIAEDVCTFNQHACIAPQAYLVEGEPDRVRLLAQSVARALDDYSRACPLGELEESDAAALQLRRATSAWNAAARPGCELWQAQSLDWTVVLDSELGAASGAGNRYLRIVPVASLEEAVQNVRPLARHLQNVGLGACGHRFWEVARELAALGACRVSEPGRMAEPSLMWRHDSEPCIARLVRWCDIEMHREAHRPG